MNYRQFHTRTFINKTAGYQRHILRFPIFVKKAFKRWKSFFSKKHSSSYFLNFATFKVFWLFAQNNLIFRVEMTFLGDSTIRYAFYSKFAAFKDFEKNQVFFCKNPSIFFTKINQTSNGLRNLCISVTFYGKFALNWSKKRFLFRSVNKLADVVWTQLANIWLKNIGNGPFERKILLSDC